MTVVLQLVHQGNSYQREPDSVRKVGNILSPKLPGTTLDGTLSDSSRMNGSQEGWRPRDFPPHSRTFGERELQRLAQLLTQVNLQVRSLDPAAATTEAPAFWAAFACALHTSLAATANTTRGAGTVALWGMELGPFTAAAYAGASSQPCTVSHAKRSATVELAWTPNDLKGFLSSGTRGGSSASGALSLLLLGLLLQGVAGDG
ncbi:hypothetical protein U0070_021897 [Myodes glareolus]|uniref:Uncharacterized protein n=1 Tax=Myodes glareolus TaxID=447135 RepID=A0AAW0IEP3_MYOGA